MIHAYRETYLNKAQSSLGEAFDYAINTCKIAGEDFIKLFLASTACKHIQNGEISYIAGKSGIEIALDIISETTNKKIAVKPEDHFSRSREYWIGWAVAYYQWYSCRNFSEIFEVLSFDDLSQMYYKLHEADITKFADIANERLREHFPDTNLKRIRLTYGCTQAELAKMSDVSLRSIQMYEQRNKNINKASIDTVYRLAKVLGCTIDDLMEKQTV